MQKQKKENNMQFITQQNYFSYLFFIFITQIMSTPIKLALKDSALSTTTLYSSTSTSSSKHNSFNINLRIIAILAAGLILVIIIVRICVFFMTSSRAPNNPLSPIRRTNLIEPQIAIIGQNTFKPDLPPAYTEAVANIDIDESKLPSYDELHNQQRTTPTVIT